MKVNIILVTYEGDKRTEERWEDIEPDRKKKIAAELTGRFMRTAGFSPIETPGDGSQSKGELT